MQNLSPQKRNPVKALTGALFVLTLCAAHVARAGEESFFPDDESFFTLESLQGNYAYVNNTAGVASFGPMLFDGRGGVTLEDKVNLPCSTPNVGCSRILSQLTGVGSYTVNSDGTGVATITFTESNGTTRPPDVFDFMISETTKKGDILLATQVFSADRSGGLAGQLVAPTWTRISEPAPRWPAHYRPPTKTH
jgi:hypothetical protein